jgi:hypothetical protein
MLASAGPWGDFAGNVAAGPWNGPCAFCSNIPFERMPPTPYIALAAVSWGGGKEVWAMKRLVIAAVIAAGLVGAALYSAQARTCYTNCYGNTCTTTCY